MGSYSVLYMAPSGAELLKRSDSGWYLAHDCHYVIEDGVAYGPSITLERTYRTNPETADFRVGGGGIS